MVIPMGPVRRAGHFPWMSLSIVGVTVFVHFAPDWFWSLLSNESWERILVFHDDLNIVSMIGCLFAHGSNGHIFWNMFFFWSVAPWTERMLGPWKFLGTYFLLGIGSALFGALCNIYVFNHWGGGGIGASGAVSGLMGLVGVRLAFKRTRFLLFDIIPSPIRIPYSVVFLEYLIFNLLYMYKDLFRTIRIDHAAHVGGFLTGAGLAIWMGGLKMAWRDEVWENASRFIGRRNNQGYLVRKMKQLADLTPTDGTPFCEIGEAEAKMGNFDKARKNFERGLHLFVRNADTLPEACFWMDAWMRHFPQKLPENKTISLKIAHFFADNREFHKALQIYDLLIRDMSVSLNIREEATVERAFIVCDKIGNLETGLAHYREFFETYPNSKYRQAAKLKYEHFLQQFTPTERPEKLLME